MTELSNKFPRDYDGSINIDIWLQQLPLKKKPSDILRQVCFVSRVTEDYPGLGGLSCFEQGLQLARLIAELQLDQQAIAAALLYNSVYYGALKLEDVAEQFSPSLFEIVKGVQQLGNLTELHQISNDHQINHLRRMLLAIVRDVRVIVIKLAERLGIMRTIKMVKIKQMDDSYKRLATETMTVYAPLANRLGIHQLKWELEDIAFYFLHWQTYKHIARQLHLRRLEREQVVSEIVNHLKLALIKINITVEVYGRVKHIYSIYRKMERKNINFEQIYDAHAIRIITINQRDCYQVLSIIHSLWQPITEEFDDYIRHPKANGYQSIHTAVKVRENCNFEIQIRTQQMHQNAEKGVAAHWLYKEGSRHKGESYEQQIIWLRQLLAWQRDMGNNKSWSPHVEKKILKERVYVFTPNGEIIDLPAGATPLDFAYAIHTEIGHRCQGVKVNGHLVSLTYPLKTGEQIEILTGKTSKPSRDWLLKQYGYLKTPRARLKVLHWFKQQDIKHHIDEAKLMLDREIQRLSLPDVRYDRIAHHFNYKNSNGMLAALGNGDLRLATIISYLERSHHKASHMAKLTKARRSKKPTVYHKNDIRIDGAGNFVTRIAQCCQPIPGDPIIGYLTIGRGVSIHHQSCDKIVDTHRDDKKRLIQVSWASKHGQHYRVDIIIKAFDRTRLMHDIVNMMSHDNISVTAVHSTVDQVKNLATLYFTIEINNFSQLSGMLNRIHQLPNVFMAKRHLKG